MFEVCKKSKKITEICCENAQKHDDGFGDFHSVYKNEKTDQKGLFLQKQVTIMNNDIRDDSLVDSICRQHRI